MAVGHWQRGMLDDARAIIRRRRIAAREVKRHQAGGDGRSELGIIANMRGDLPRALRHYEASLAGYRELGLDEFIGKLLANMGMAYADSSAGRRPSESTQEALAICAACGDVQHRAHDRGQPRRSADRARPLPEARLVCERVLRRAQALNDARAVAEAQKHLGVISRETGRLDDADSFLRIAFASATTREDLSARRRSRAREQAELYSVMRRERETLQALNTSHRLFGELRAQRDIADITRRMRGLEQRFYDIVGAWARSIESKDPYTLGHCERVADYACAIFRAVDPNERSALLVPDGRPAPRRRQDQRADRGAQQARQAHAGGARADGEPPGRPASSCSRTWSSHGTCCRWCAATTSAGTARDIPIA